jgi:hypothetical protein
MDFFRKLLTEPDNSTPCFVRIIGGFGTLQGLASHAYQTFWLHAPFDFQAFGLGLAATLAALGAALGMKKDTQP